MGASVRPEPDLDSLITARRKALSGEPNLDSIIASRRQVLNVPAVASDATASRLGSKPTPTDPGGILPALVRGVSQGATFGFADEAASALDALKDKLTGGSGTYQSHLAENRAKLRASREAHPVAEIAGELGGGVAGGGALGLGVRATREAATASRLANLTRDVAAASAAGGVAAAGSADGSLGDRARAIPMGAAFGAGTVLGLKGIGAAANATGAPTVLKNVLPRAASVETPIGRLSQRLGVMTTPELAQADVIKQLQRAGMTVDDAAARAAAAHPEQMLLDAEVGGKSMLRRARGVQSIPSRGSEQVEQALVTRNESAPGRIQTLLESESGHTKDNAVLRAEALKGERSATAAVNYPKAYDAPPVENPDVLGLFSDPVFKRAHAIGRRIAKREGVDLPPLTRTVEIGGETVKELIPQPVQAFDYMKHGLDDLIETGGKSKRAIGRMEARVTRQRLNAALEMIDADPTYAPYAEARRAFREQSKGMEAQQLGSKLYSTKNDALEAAVPRLPASAQEEFRRAALGATEERLAGVGEGGNAANALTRNDILKQKLRLLFPNNESADRVLSLMDAEKAMHKNASFVLSGSPTARIMAEQTDEVGPRLADVTNAATGNVGGLLTKLMTNGVAARMRGLSEAQSSALAPLLTARGATLQEVLAQLRAFADQQAAQQARMRLLPRSIGQAAGASAGHR